MHQQIIHRLIEDARCFYEHGWLMGTSGNLSARIDEARFVITASGKDKGRLCEEDFVVCEVATGEPIAGERNKPSAETSLHRTIYTHNARAQAVYHVHEPFAALCSHRDGALGYTRVRDVEMIKGLGLWEDGAVLDIPILPNPAHIPALDKHVRTHLMSRRGKDGFDIPCVNILRHGPYVWGDSQFEAKRHLESLAYLFQYSWHVMSTPAR